jgi:hypothetical protein
MIKKGYDNEFFDKGNGKFDTKTRFYVEYIDYDENRRIKDLIIRDNKNNIRFSELTQETEKRLGEKNLKLRKLIELREEKDNDFSRETLYKYYNVESDSQLTIKQVDEIIKLMEKKGE